MAKQSPTQAVCEANGCTFQWKIENLSHCWLKKGEQIKSPPFIAETLEGTKWSLWLYPMGNTDEYFVGLYLHREIDCSGPKNFEVSYQLAFLDKDGSILTDRIKSNYNLWKGNYFGFHKYVAREKVFDTDREAFLPEDTLTVQCTIWNKEDKPVKSKHLNARTIIKEKRRSFVWRIDKFSILKHDVRNKFKDGLIDIDLVLNKEQGFEKKMVINIHSFHESIKYISFKPYIVDSDGKKENCGLHEYFADDLNKVKLSTRLFTKKLMENKSQYLPIDALSLHFEYVSSTKTAFYESSDSNSISPKFANEVVESKNEEYVGKENSLNTSVLVNDLKLMYNEEIFSDIEIRTSKQTFSAHKAILSARSPVFRNMFSNDMKEKNRGYVDITDLKEDTVHRMLLYIYTNALGDLQFESASKLYVAADKYEILPLKNSCSTFLKENLCPTKYCEVLVLADLHHDEDMKSAVQDYILGQDKEFFCSHEWKDFMNTHVKLAADIMYRKIYQE